MRLFDRQPRRGPHDPVEISEKKGVRYLHLGGMAIQSAMRIKAPYDLELEYTRAMMAFLLFQPMPREVALIGLGGGSVAKFIHRHLVKTRLTVLEVNPEVVTAARSYFLLPEEEARFRVIVGDGAAYVRAQDGRLDVLLVDGYDANRIAQGLAAPEFYAACRRALRPAGVAVFNLWGGDRFYDTYVGRLAQAFDGQILALPGERKNNVQVFAFAAPLAVGTIAALEARACGLEAEFGLEMPVFVARMRHLNAF